MTIIESRTRSTSWQAKFEGVDSCLDESRADELLHLNDSFLGEEWSAAVTIAIAHLISTLEKKGNSWQFIFRETGATDGQGHVTSLSFCTDPRSHGAEQRLQSGFRWYRRALAKIGWSEHSKWGDEWFKVNLKSNAR
jgi:hypothetical protein